MARTWPLRHWLALRFALAAALPLAVVAALVWTVLLPQLHTHIAAQHQTLARAIVGQVETYLTGAQRQLDTIADLLQSVGYRPAPYWFDSLDAHVGDGSVFEAIYLVNADDTVHSVGLPPPQRGRREDMLGLDLSRRVFLHQARTRKAAVWSETFLSVVTGRLAVAVAIPAADQAVVGEIAVEPLSSLINRLFEESGLITLITDSRGQLIADSRHILSGQQLNLGYLPIIRNASQNQLTTREFALNNESFIGTAAKTPQIGWTVLIAQPRPQALQLITTIFWVMIVGVGVALFLATLAGWQLSRDFSRRFNRYTEQSHAIANGDYERAWPLSHIEEFADLANDLQQMSLAIRQREQALIASETRFRDLSAMASDWFWEQDEQFRFTYFSRGSLRSPMSLTDAIGKTRWELPTRLTTEQWAAHRAILDAHQPFWEFEYCVSTGTADRWISITGQPLFEETGRFIGYRGTGCDITERHQAELALRCSEEKFANIFLTTPDAVVISRVQDGLLLEVNPGFEAIVGYRREEVIGRTTLDLQLWADPVERDQLVRDLRSYGQLLYRNFTFRRNDGALRAGQFSARPIAIRDESCLLFIMQDVTERRRAEEALRASEARYRSLFERANDAIFVIDKQTGRCLDANDAAVHLTGRSRAAIATLNITDFTELDIPYSLSQHLAEATDSLSLGEVTYLQPEGVQRIARLSIVPVSDALAFGMAHDITEIRSAEQRIEHLAYYDALTDLPNRELLAQRANLALALAARRRNGLAVLFLDLDRFKDVNDSLGHAEGDALLIQVATRLQEQIRETDTVCRLGGDEFVLLLPDVDQEGALQVADKILAAFRQPFPLAGHHLRATVSIGIALYPHDGDDFANLLKNADAALYQAKQDGRNTRAFYAREMNVATFERLVLETELRKAISAGQLRAYYQIKVQLSDGQPIGAEALVRWLHPDHGLIPPGRFIPLAESSDLIVDLGDWMLAEVCQQLVTWRNAGLPPLTVAINLAARHFRDPGLAMRIQSLLTAYQLPPQALELELTESSLLEIGPQTAETLLALERLGVGLAIDDFGTGYSSLSYLKRLPLTALKIDQSFVRDLVSDPDDRTLAATIVALGHGLGLKVVAEGVETEEQRQILLDQGCDLAQGYYFGRPTPAEEFTARLSPISPATAPLAAPLTR